MISDSSKNIDVSIIVPVRNGEKWVEKCFLSIINQTALSKNITLEISICNDASTDNTQSLLDIWKNIFLKHNIDCVINENNTAPKGAGYAKNVAVKASNGEYLCFQDIDDEMYPERIWEQYTVGKLQKDMIIGSKFIRDPPNSTIRYTQWANNLTQDQLLNQIYTSHGPTIIMPTWFMHRSIFNKVGGFSIEGTKAPEDLIFFYKHIDNNGKICRIDKPLVIYRYHAEATTFTISSENIWKKRFNQLRKDYFPKCINGFTIWNAGKQGRFFFKYLNDNEKSLVRYMCDINSNKVGKFYEMYCPIKRKVLFKIPIIHFSVAKPPIIICVKMDMTNGDFERNLESMNLREGTDYILFS